MFSVHFLNYKNCVIMSGYRTGASHIVLPRQMDKFNVKGEIPVKPLFFKQAISISKVIEIKNNDRLYPGHRPICSYNLPNQAGVIYTRRLKPHQMSKENPDICSENCLLTIVDISFFKRTSFYHSRT